MSGELSSIIFMSRQKFNLNEKVLISLMTSFLVEMFNFKKIIEKYSSRNTMHAKLVLGLPLKMRHFREIVFSIYFPRCNSWASNVKELWISKNYKFSEIAGYPSNIIATGIDEI